MPPTPRSPTLPGRLPLADAWPAGDPTLRASFLTLPSGEQVRVVEGGPPDGPPVTMLAGWGCWGYVFRRNVPALVAAGFRVVLPDLRGQGFSAKPDDPAAYTIDALAELAVAVLDALAIAHTVLVGHSMSGAVALRVAERHPARVDALGLLSPVGIGRIHWGVLPWIPVGRAATPAWLTQLLPHAVGRWVISLILTLAYGRRNGFDDHDVDEFWAPSQFPGFAYAARHLLHVFDWSVASDDRLGRLPTRTLVAMGSRDRFVDPAGVDRVRHAAPHAEVVLVPGAGHILPEESPDTVNPLLVALARRVQIDPPTG